MDVAADLEAPCSAADLFALVEDLDRYPEWLTIVPRAVRDPGERPGTVEGDGGGDGVPAWSVDLRGRLGPLARSKRLRMVRTVHEAPTEVRFERRELDGRSHSAWVLHAVVSERDGGSRLEMRLHYGGGFGGALLERMLRDEIERSRPKLLELLATPSG